MRLRRAAKPPTFDLSLAARTRHAWLARLTRARGRRYIRGRKALLNDFCRAFGHSKAREKKKLLYVSSRANNVRPPSRRRRPSLLRKSVNPPSWRRRPSLLRKSVNPPIVAHTKNSAQFLCKITKCKFVLKKDRLFHIFIV